jgi:hypothetical protein
MADKKFIFIFFYVAIFLFSGLLYAQEPSPEPQPGYFVDKSAGEPVFIQRFAWDKEEYALYYEVAIQILSGQYGEYYSEITEKTFIEISLHPGRYRYSVTPYDLLGRRGDASEWEEFTVNPAFQPEIIKITPEFFYMDQIQDRVLFIAGNNLLDDSVIILRNAANDLVPIDKVITNNSRAKLTFDDETLIPGTYEIYIINPGGLDVVYRSFFVGYHKSLSSYIKVSFIPSIPLYGELQDMFGSYLYLPCMTLGLDSVSSKRTSFKAGMEFDAAINIFNPLLSIRPSNSTSLAGIGAGAIITEFNVNISMQSSFNRFRNAISFRIGFGMSSINGFGNYSRNEINGHMNLGISCLFLLYEIFYLEAGVDFNHYIAGASGVLKPRVGIAWKF